MHKLSMALLFCLISSIAHAQQELPEVLDVLKPMQCIRTNTLFQMLEQERQQRQLWVGKDAITGTYVSLWINNILGTWTMIQYDGMMGCVLATGEQASAI